jgi:hypothetical protein
MAARVFIALLVSALLSNAARASSLSDLWWNPAEAGWGVNVIQQQDVLFLTFFVYGSDGKPAWYAGSDTRRTEFWSNNFEGPLHVHQGAWFGGAWNSGMGSARQVGTVRFSLNADGTAALTYSVDGAQVAKSLQRYTFGVIPFISDGLVPPPPVPSTPYVGTFQLAEVAGFNCAGSLDATPWVSPARDFNLVASANKNGTGTLRLEVGALVAEGTYTQNGSAFKARMETIVAAGTPSYLQPGRYVVDIDPLVLDGAFVHGYVRFRASTCGLGFAMAGHVPTILYSLASP